MSRTIIIHADGRVTIEEGTHGSEKQAKREVQQYSAITTEEIHEIATQLYDAAIHRGLGNSAWSRKNVDAYQNITYDKLVVIREISAVIAALQLARPIVR